MVQVNLDCSPFPIFFMHSTPVRDCFKKLKIIDTKRKRISFRVRYDKISWVKCRYIGSSSTVSRGVDIEKMPMPIHEHPHDQVTLTNYCDKFIVVSGGVLAEDDKQTP